MLLVLSEVDLARVRLGVVQLVLLVPLRHLMERNYRVLCGLKRSLVLSYQETEGILLPLAGAVTMARNQ